jgi:DNA-binding PadR family transcriptional regulator
MVRVRGQGHSFDECLLHMLVIAPASGYDLARRLGTGQESAPGVARNLYLALHGLERRGLLDAEWRPVSGRTLSTKYYRVTAHGRRRLGHASCDRGRGSAIQPLAMLVVMSVIGPWDASAGLRRSRQPPLMIVVSTQVPISFEELRRASLDVNRILGAIGIQTDWVFDDSLSTQQPSRSAEQPTGVAVHATILAGGPTPIRSGEALLGVTLPGVHESDADVLVFYDRILEFPQRQQKGVSTILALVIAHEIGHVLLPAPAHANVGIMQAPWDRHALDQADEHGLLFMAPGAAHTATIESLLSNGS